jgi:hypothetical protein
MAIPIISVIKWRILIIAYGIIRLAARCFAVVLICQYTIADNCYKIFLLLNNLKLFSRYTLLALNCTYNIFSLSLKLNVLLHEAMYTRVFFYLTFYSAVHNSSYAKLNSTWGFVNVTF